MDNAEQVEREDESTPANDAGVDRSSKETWGDRASDVVDNNRSRSRSAAFFAWLSKQSLPRFLGLLVGDTRALEARLADKDKEIEWLRARLDAQYPVASEASGSLDLQLPVKSSPLPTSIQRNVNPILSHALELDQLKELFLYSPQEVLQKIGDLQANPTPRNKQILVEYEKWLDSLKIDDTPRDGVVIMS